MGFSQICAQDCEIAAFSKMYIDPIQAYISIAALILRCSVSNNVMFGRLVPRTKTGTCFTDQMISLDKRAVTYAFHIWIMIGPVFVCMH